MFNKKKKQQAKDAELMKTIVDKHEFEGKDYWLTQQNDQQSIPMSFLFAREAWDGVIKPSQTEWIDQLTTDLKSREDRGDLYAMRFLPEQPDLLAALNTLKEQGVDEAALSFLVRAMQKNVLYHLTNLLDGGHCFEDGLESNWGAFELNENLEVGRQFVMLKDILHELDPGDDD